LIPLQITWRDIPQSDAIEADIRSRAEKLDQFCDQILGCKVAVGAPKRGQHSGNLYQVHLDITVPGKEIAVSREPGTEHSHEDMYVTIHDAFDAARRQLQDYMSIRRGRVKQHTQHRPEVPELPQAD